MIAKALKYYHTIKHLKWIQIRYQLRNRFLRSNHKNKRLGNNKYLEIHPLILIDSIVSPDSFRGENCFQFLNVEHKFSDNIDWNYSINGKLWTYNLNYFEFLTQQDITKKQGLYLIHDFIANLEYIKDGMESFPISLRIIFWIKFLIKHDISDSEIDQSLYNQIYKLSRCPEYHLMGNHLLENGFGLLFGGSYFKDEKILSQANKILQEQLEEQILADGGHFELSPMYHQIMLYRMLDSINLIQQNPGLDLGRLLKMLISKAELMLGWLCNMTMLNGSVPMFNDSTNGIAPTPDQLHAYADRLGVNSHIVPLGESGYRKMTNSDYELILDVGQIGPDYIPGHAHSDTFNFIYHHNETPIIIDTGISTYEKNEIRTYQRSTAAHNTVMLNGMEQSEVWGGFRVARRATVKDLIENKTTFSAAHNGYQKINATHHRSFTCGDDRVEIKDTITQGILAEAFLHFHPDIEVSLIDQELHGKFGKITFDNMIKIKLEQVEIALGFNKTISTNKAIITFKETLQTQIVSK